MRASKGCCWIVCKFCWNEVCVWVFFFLAHTVRPRG